MSPGPGGHDGAPVRVVLVDDSPLFRKMLRAGLEADPRIVVVGEAATGEQALQQVLALGPDLVTMDVIMPGMDGFTVVERIMAQRPTPILVISSLSREAIVFRMLAAGALDVVAKPGSGSDAFLPLVEAVKALAGARVGAAREAARDTAARDTAGRAARATPARDVARDAAGRESAARAAAPAPAPRRPAAATAAPAGERLVVIASSAGGPQALATVLAGLPAGLRAPVVVIQHIASGFGRGLANWLDGAGPLPVEVIDGLRPLRNGVVHIAPDDAHVVVGRERRVLLDRGPRSALLVRPAADITLRSAAAIYGPNLLAVVLTGMGSDGAAGASAVRASGGRVLVQDEASSVVYGMPGAARPYADAEVALADVARRIAEFVSAARG